MSKKFPHYMPLEYMPKPMDIHNMKELGLNPKDQVIKALLTEIGKLKSEVAELKDDSKFKLIAYTHSIKGSGDLPPNMNYWTTKHRAQKSAEKRRPIPTVIPLYVRKNNEPTGAKSQ